MASGFPWRAIAARNVAVTTALDGESVSAWPSFHVPPWTIEYKESPLDAQALAAANANINKCKVPDLVGDLSDLMDLALKLDLDPVRLHAELMRRQPETFAETLSRLAALSKLPRVGGS
jgi:hypothetical protein